MNELKQITDITISFPNWFYGFLTLGIIAFIFYLGSFYAKLNILIKEHPRICKALNRISELLILRGLTKLHLYTVSPICLTADGEKVVKETKFAEFYDVNKKLLHDRIAKTNPKTMADLEEACKQIMVQIEENLPGFDSIKQYSYQHGEPISNILFTCAIALRDYLSKELDIK